MKKPNGFMFHNGACDYMENGDMIWDHRKNPEVGYAYHWSIVDDGRLQYLFPMADGSTDTNFPTSKKHCRDILNLIYNYFSHQLLTEDTDE